MRAGVVGMRRHSLKVALVGGLSAVLLGGASSVAVAVAGGSPGARPPVRGMGSVAGAVAPLTAPALPGEVVDVTLTDMGAAMYGRSAGPRDRGGMMGGGYGPAGGYGMMGGPWRGRMMQVRLDRHTVPAGTVSLRVSDIGAMDHELVVLPLAAGARVGERAVGPDGTVDENGSLGEASNNDGPGEGEGLRPGGTGWTTLHLRPGRYELVCNLPGHYAAGMFAELDVVG